MNEVTRLSVIGLGKLGSPMAAVFASKGFDVIGLDLNESFVDALNSGRCPVDEPQVQDLLSASRARFRATTSFDEAIAGSDVSFVIVPTPSGSDHFFSNDLVVEAVRRIGSALGSKDDHLVVVTSTVMPGSTGGVIRKALEQSSGRTLGHGIGLLYSPEFIALGSVVRDLLSPDMVLIGEGDHSAYGDLLERIYRASTNSNPAVHRMRYVNAELCKIAVNTFVTTKISYANMLTEICDRLDDADVDAITRALGADTRIGGKYLRGGVAYGGPCFPRDNKAFAALARALGVPCDIAEATDRINDHQVDRLLGSVEALAKRGARVAILGLSYKPDTPVVERSQGVALARLLATEGYRVVVADPMSAASAFDAIGAKVEVAPSLERAVSSAEIAVITTPWPQIRELPLSAFARPSGRLPVIDPWGMLRDSPILDVAHVVMPGRGGSASVPATRLAHTGPPV